MFARCLERVAVCRRHDSAAFVPWSIDGVAVGRVHRDRLTALLAPPSPFVQSAERLELAGAPGFAARSAALAAWVDHAANAGWLRPPTGERYPVGARLGMEPLAAVDRSAVAWLGVGAQGVHLNGWVWRGDRRCLWVARRSRDKATFPGHLDNLVAGGQGLGFTPQQTLRKECQEEAGLPAPLADRAVAVGAISYLHQDGLGSKADTLWLFDLDLPPDFEPRPVDGEVEAFECWPCERVVASLIGDAPWKPNCALVALDFLLRHGELDAVLSGPERWQLWRALRDG